MDWDHDGDEDYIDGVVEGVFWFGPWWFAVLILLISFGIYWYVTP